MKKRVLVALCVAGWSSLWGQQVTDRRSAEIRGGGGEGKCTIEVEVDDVAEIEINGPNAIIRTINGGPSSFRRFQCNQSMPNRPAGFRFEGIDGRGRQELIRSAEDGGRAIIRIEDSKGGREGYTFDIFWRGSGGGGGIFGGRNGGGFNNGQVTDRRSAEIRGGGGEGKCTIEVEVDDVAEIEINGPNAIIHTINGGPASFRRFQCNQTMPNRPAGFRFEGIDGRGRQELIRSAEDGGRAIIRIEDSKGGREGYTFDIFWRGSGGGGGIFGGGNGGGFNNGNAGGWNNDRGNRGGWSNNRGNGDGWNNNGDLNFEGGNRGSGSYRDQNGNMRRLDRVRVTINRSGELFVEFQGERGRMEFRGPVDRRQGRRILSNVRNSDMSGLMEIEMGQGDNVSRITIRSIDLNWSN